jgi:hypothetical protein
MAAVAAVPYEPSQDEHEEALPVTDAFTTDITARARWARAHNDDYPKPAWSTGEKLAVALVLGNDAYLDAVGYTRQEAAQRLSGDLLGADVNDWLARIRSAL